MAWLELKGYARLGEIGASAVLVTHDFLAPEDFWYYWLIIFKLSLYGRARWVIEDALLNCELFLIKQVLNQ